MNLDAPFFPALWQLAVDTATRPEVYLAVWLAESGLDPAAQNAIGCIGLNQSCPAPHGPGFPSDPDAYRASSASAQLAWIGPQVRRAIAKNGRPFTSAARAYQANFLPATLSTARAPGDVVAAASGPYPEAYAANRQLDTRAVGTITLDDLGAFVERAIAAQRSAWADVLAATYAARPADAPWSAPSLMIYEPRLGSRGGIAIALGLVGLTLVLGARR